MGVRVCVYMRERVWVGVRVWMGVRVCVGASMGVCDEMRERKTKLKKSFFSKVSYFYASAFHRCLSIQNLLSSIK